MTRTCNWLGAPRKLPGAPQLVLTPRARVCVWLQCTQRARGCVWLAAGRLATRFAKEFDKKYSSKREGKSVFDSPRTMARLRKQAQRTKGEHPTRLCASRLDDTGASNVVRGFVVGVRTW